MPSATKLGDAPPARRRARTTIVRLVVPLVARPLSHRALLTLPSRDRSRGGMTASLAPAICGLIAHCSDQSRKGRHARARQHNDEADTAGGHRARLRQRLLDARAGGFLDYELVEYLLALAIPRVDTKPLAKRLIARVRRDRAAAVARAPRRCAAKA